MDFKHKLSTLTVMREHINRKTGILKMIEMLYFFIFISVLKPPKFFVENL